MKLSINILTWNNISTIKKLLDAVYDDCLIFQTEYIFVDNGSNDGTREYISEWSLSKPYINKKLIFNQQNTGISRGKNAGIDNSVGEYIFMLDGDVVPVKNTLPLMIRWLDENPDKSALGMFPNKFSTTEDHAEKHCDKLVGFREYPCCCLYYGLFRRSIFVDGLRMNTKGEYGLPGYGWEDHDFFKRMSDVGVKQYVAHINRESGKYYHHINSSIRAMGRDKYMETSRSRGQQFKKDWENATR